MNNLYLSEKVKLALSYGDAMLTLNDSTKRQPDLISSPITEQSILLLLPEVKQKKTMRKLSRQNQKMEKQCLT